MLPKVYIVLEYSYVRKNTKIQSVHSTYDGAYDAMEEYADYSGNAGYRFNIVLNKKAGTAVVQSVDEREDEMTCYISNTYAYKIKEMTLFT